MSIDNIDADYFLRVHEQIGTISDSDIAVSCPMCREGKSWGRKHRLHLYTKDSFDAPAVHCWNCGYSSNMFGYLSEFYPQEFSSYKKAKAGNSFKELRMSIEPKVKSTKLDFSNVDIGMDMTKKPEPTKPPTIKPMETRIEINDNSMADGETSVSANDMASIGGGLDFGDFSAPLDIKEVKEKLVIEGDKHTPNLLNPKNILPKLVELPEDAKTYIRNRGIEPQEHWLYSPLKNSIQFNDTEVFLSEYIIIPLILNNKWYGFQALAWKQKKFFVYLVSGNTSWKVENWENIDKNEPVYIFESIYDRLSSGLKNSVAVLGSYLHEDRIKELKTPVFCLDNTLVDDKAKEETIKYLQMGYKAFIWPQGSERFKDTNDLRKIRVPFEKISKMIINNIHQGISGTIRAKMIN